MKKIIYALILPLVVVSGLVFANREIKDKNAKKPAPKQLTAAEWKATPEGIKYTQWTASPAGQKVFAAVAKIRKNVNDYTNMEAVITSLSLPPGSRLGFGVMARINGDDYIVTFDADKSQLEQLHSLKVNDKLIIKSHNISHAPKYAYPIVRGEEVVRDGKVFYKRIPPKGGC